jgi:hypothetical protein
VTAQATVARIGQGPVLAAILGATAVVGFGIGVLIGSQPSGPASERPVAVATASPSPSPTPTLTPSVAPTARPASTPDASASPAAPAGPREVVLVFSGTQHDVSAPFDVVPGWQIQWQTDGSSLAIAVTGDQNLGVVVNEPGPASGVMSLPPEGTFRLNIVASGPWSITVIQGEESAST